MKRFSKVLFIIIIVLITLLAGFYFRLKWKNKNVTKESITADMSTEELFNTRCGICHGGGSPEAPSIAALKLLPEKTILSTLKTGVMMNQSMMLSDKQHRALAAYISDIDPHQNTTVEKGLCASADTSMTSDGPQISTWGIGYKNQRYYNSPDLKITADNAKDLQLDWVFAFPNSSRARVQPTIAGNTLYTASQLGTVYALDRHTGCIQWTFQADAEIRSAMVIDYDHKGVPSRLYFGDFLARVYALDLKTHELLWKKEIDDHPVATITGTLSLYEDRLYVPISSTEVLSAADDDYECCTFRGALAAIDKETGNTIWKTHTIKEKPSPQGTNKKGVTIMAPSGAPIWTGVTVDTMRRRLYVGSGENYTRPATLTSDAIIAFDMDDGEMLWAKQTLPRDAWNGACASLTNRANCPEANGPDADFGAPPILVNHKGKDLLLAGQKSGHVYALDPDNKGELIWTTLVSRGGMMGGIHWGMATDETTLFVPINDRGLYDINKDVPKRPGLHALNISNGEVLWRTIHEDHCPPWALRGCGPGLSAAITLTPEVVFAGSLDGIMRAYSSDDGTVLWSYDTKRDYDAVNKVKAFGGAIDSDGPIVVEDQVFVNSGYAKFAEKEGNVLLAFRLK